MIRNVLPKDAAQICRIYNDYITNSIITFEEEHISEKEMWERIESTIVTYPYLVFELDNNILGYAYGSQWNPRSAYRKSAEASIYLDRNHTAKGIGTQLYSELISILKKEDYHTVIGGISLPNKASVNLHHKLGFEKVAHYKEVGFKFNQWIDVGYWQLIF